LSRGPQTDEECLAAIYTRTDAHADMIVNAGLKAAGAGGYDAPEWTKPASADAPATPGTCEGDTCTDTSATEPASDAPQTTTKTTSGCSTSGTSSRDSFGVLALAAMTVLVTRRRRRA